MDKVNIKQLTKAGLKDLCDQYGLETSGNKSALQKRLSEYSKSPPPVEDEAEVNDDDEVDDHTDEDDIKPHASASNRGSTTSSVRSKRALNIARLKGLQVQRDALQKEQ